MITQTLVVLRPVIEVVLGFAPKLLCQSAPKALNAVEFVELTPYTSILVWYSDICCVTALAKDQAILSEQSLASIRCKLTQRKHGIYSHLP